MFWLDLLVSIGGGYGFICEKGCEVLVCDYIYM